MEQNHPSISGKTRLYGVLGDPIEHVQAPTVANSLFVELGIDAVYLPLHVTAEHLAEAVAGLKHIRNFDGYGVTIPHKGAIASHCDELMPNARGCGVVNNIRVDPPYFNPALRRPLIKRSVSAFFLYGSFFAKCSEEKLESILRTSAASARASSSRPNEP